MVEMHLNEPPKDYDKFYDLEDSEYGPSDRPQPFWGINGKHTLILLLASFPISAVATWLVTGQFPYWVKSFLE